MTMSLKLTFDFDPDRIVAEIQKQVRTIFDEETLDLADELQRNSPEGATGELKAGWNVQPAARQRNSINVRAVVTNTADNAINRIAGRPPGKQPPTDALTEWVQIKIESDPKKARRIAFLIGRKIGRRGTETFIRRDNFAGLNLDGSYVSGGILARAEDRMQQRLKAIVIVQPKRGKKTTVGGKNK